MILILKIIFWFSLFIVFWANIGYQVSLVILSKSIKRKNEKLTNYFPSVTIMVVAHNEEKVILDKLKNLEHIKYPRDKLSILVSSDNSTDLTNHIVEEYIQNNSEMNINIYKSKNRMGKTNAQNEAQKLVHSEFLIMTDANSMLGEESVKELMSSFSNEEVAYVTGKLIYTNNGKSDTSTNESLYWNLDLRLREIESNIQTITAGNGALYAIRNSSYYDFDPIESHDSSMPIYYALNGKRAIYNPDAVAYEKAGENTKDEFSRKIRMNRVLLSHILPNIHILNFFKYKWFTYFYLGHRTSRYLLWIAHLLLLLTNIVLSFTYSAFLFILIPHLLVIILGGLQFILKSKNRILNMIYYYLVTITAQYVGIWNKLSGKSKPFWEKVETTR